MRSLPESLSDFDLIWCEGAAYMLGFAHALGLWKPLLKKGGKIALTEPVWLQSDPPKTVRTEWDEYPDMIDVPACRDLIEALGYHLL